MSTPPLPDELLIEAVQVRNQHPTLRAAAEALGISWNAMNNRLLRAAQRGLDGSVPEPVPIGQKIKGLSTLYGPNGDVLMQWVKTSTDQSAQQFLEAIEGAFERYRGHAALPPAPQHVNADLATVYNIADHHLGLYAWAEEAGEDYDLEIGERALKNAMSDLVAHTPASETALVLNLGDFFHSDTNENRTARSGNALDVDTRYAKVLQVGVELMIECIELALQKHAKVIVRCLPGNHDPHTALTLSVALAAFFHNNERVHVDRDPSKFFWWRFGKVFIGATHGDMVKPDEMPGVMASFMPKDWGESVYRYAYFGHVHHKSKGGGEKHGVVWETFQSLSAKDAWHRASGYASGRSMVAITHHRDKGEVFRHTVCART
ncbi:metallophosphoesterase [Rhodoligotrophos defluvii]|uniref:metallophosphoesterase n=1 Tax=Rhodoligotrophos defluvii TaxID=2561934 RepID=UPI0010C99AE2|nr:metallophosphoesterase [Rhodoligotrophos defluvii]